MELIPRIFKLSKCSKFTTLISISRMLLLHFRSYSQVCCSPKPGNFQLMIKSPVRVEYYLVGIMQLVGVPKTCLGF